MSGKPAARQGDMTQKGGPIVQGSATVLIGSAGGVACSECPGGMAVGSPVNPSLGAKVLSSGDDLDFALPGPMPLVWQRVYSSYVNTEHGSACGLLGHGWKLPMEAAVRLETERAVLLDAAGRAITFDEPLEPGQALYSASEDLWLLRGGGAHAGAAPEGAASPNHGASAEELRPWAWQPRWAHVPALLRADARCVVAASGASSTAWVFLPASHGPGSHALHEVLDRFGRSQRYHWGDSGLEQGRLVGITDGSGRRYRLHYERIAPDGTAVATAHPLLGPDDGVRLAGVDCTANPHDPAQVPGAAARAQPLVRYRYDAEGNLAEVLGQDGAVLRRFGYDLVHRMTSHRVRQGPLHRYVYEDTVTGHGPGTAPRPDARVIEQHNEEGLSYFFDYRDPLPRTAQEQANGARVASCTVVRDSLGRTTAYHFEGEGGLKRLMRLVGPDGAAQSYRYDSAGRRVAATDALGRTTWWRHDGAGRLLGVQYPDGASLQQRWGEMGSAQDGLLLESTDATGRRVLYRYDAWGRLLEVALTVASQGHAQDGAGAGMGMAASTLATRFEYAQPQPDGRFAAHEMAWCDKPVVVIDAQGGRKSLAYDGCGQLARHTDCSGSSRSWRRGAWGELIEEVDALGHRTRYHYATSQGALRLVGVEAPGNTAMRYRWSASGALESITQGTHEVLEGTGEAAGTSATVTYRHDLWGRVVEQTQAGRGVQMRYDLAGRLLELVNENGDATRFVHDMADRLVQEVGFDGRSLVHGWDAAGQLTHSSDGHAAGHHPGRAAGAGAGTAEVAQLGDVVRSRQHYDLRGRLVARVVVRLPAVGGEAQALLQVHGFEYTPSGVLSMARAWQADLPLPPLQPGEKAVGLPERWLALDTQFLRALLERPGEPSWAALAEQLQAHRLRLDSRVSFARDAFGRACGETQTLYRQAGPQAAARSAEPAVEFEHTISHTLGPLGQRTATHAQGLGMLQWLAYGPGHVHGLLLEGTPLVDWERDGMHREVGRTLRLERPADESADGTGTPEAILHARQLDPVGRLLHQDWRGLRHAPEDPAVHAAQALGPLATLAQRQYRYDTLGQLVGIQTPGEATRFGYDAWQRLTGLQRASLGGQQHTQAHWLLDAAGNRLPSLSAGVAAGQTPPQGWAQQVRENLHDPGFDLLQATGTPGQAPGPVTRWPGNRIGWSDGENESGATRYRYDAFGNRVKALHADGHALRLHYDALHQLREVWERKEAAGAWQRTARYRYDPFGRRMARTVLSADLPQASPAMATTYAGWDGDRLVHTEAPDGIQHTLYEPGSFVPLLRLDRPQAIPSALQALLAPDGDEADDGEQAAATLFAALPRSQREALEAALESATGPGSEALLARMQAGLPAEAGALLAAGLHEAHARREAATQAAATRIRHILCDHVGTPIALVDANGPHAGLVTWAATHHAWGALREEYNPHRIAQNIRFQGQQFDEETGMHYNRFRYYDPHLGQYLSQDPIGLLGGIHKQAYPLNPLQKSDPLGLFDFSSIELPVQTPTFDGKGDTAICSYYDSMAKAKPKCSYYPAGALICRSENRLVNGAINSALIAESAIQDKSLKQSEVLNSIRGKLVKSDQEAQAAGKVDQNGCTQGNEIDAYHDKAFSESGIRSNFYGGNLWFQGTWPNPVPLDPSASKFDPRRIWN
ncbi:RHS repeat-associated core domain-containing protein [Acidovorax sp. NCPPB 4044]|uniref:RHS repeat-associated core domain-containing protein n=1 Tax=Acidovorax sp. NCPPB 4044 TaxID=2940490 RepID=UPI002304B92B|nr:RHS repeat-associated core domain-containing protein [Acidovorax sp. NCPPB 4044]MDA8522172.1 DUF6531 domain-containing protein [Acidovorax sp. NCPPB 4044]